MAPESSTSTPLARADAARAARARRALGGLERGASAPGGAIPLLLGSAAAALVLPHVPYVRWLAWPLLLLSTLAHEAGHGLAALLVGGSFERLTIFADGSGVALTGSSGGALARAVVSAGGLVGPAIASALLFVAARSARVARLVLAALALLLLLGLVLVVRGWFAFGFVALVGLALGAAARPRSPWLGRFVVVFVAVQLALSVFTRGDYLFTPVAHTSAGPMPSDVAQMADALWLPYWFWGGLCGLISVGVLLLGLWSYLHGTLGLARPRDAGRRAGRLP